MYISHELTHALQDQHLTMNPTVFPRYSYYSSDADLAQRALVEGDADFLEYAFVFNVLYGLGTPESFDSARLYAAQGKGNFLSADVSIDPPVFLGVKGYLPYLLGDAYVAQQYSGSGWNAVNYRYSISAIPRSSAEINRTAPVTIAYFEYYAIHQLLASQSGTIEFADDDNAGFALLLGLLYGDVDSTRASRSLNWLGDRYTFIKRAEQAYGTLVWSMAFESLDGANYMFTKLDQKIRSRRLGEALPYWSGVDSVTDSSGQSTTYTYSSTLFSTKLIRTGNQVWWLENTGTLDQLIITALRQQATSPALSKVAAGGGSPLPASLSPAIKRATLAGLMRHLFTR